MRVSDPLNSILNNKIKTKVLRFLCRTEAEWNGRQIAKEIGTSPASCHKALRELNNERLLLLRNVGKNFLYRVNKDNIIVSNLLKPLYRAEGKLPDLLFSAIKRGLSTTVKKNVVSLAVFGSVGRKEEGAASDIDVLVLLRDNKGRRVVVKDFEEINKKILSRFGNTISPYCQTIKEFKSKHKKGLPLIKNILQSHRLLLGEPLRELL